MRGCHGTIHYAIEGLEEDVIHYEINLIGKFSYDKWEVGGTYFNN